MNQLRILLIDCRIELRKLVRGFPETELCARLDAAVQALAKAPVDVDLSSPPSAASVREIRETSNQVALAWQMAARDLKFTHPPLYETLVKKVMARLEAKTLVDQVDELRQHENTIASLQEQQAAAEKRRLAIEGERDTLLGALASAVPELSDGGDQVGVALARIDWLKAHMAKASPAAAMSARHAEESRVPTAETLTAVATGGRRFTNAQREWCVGEAMVLSGFKLTPMELIEQGDARIAQLIVEAGR